MLKQNKTKMKLEEEDKVLEAGDVEHKENKNKSKAMAHC